MHGYMCIMYFFSYVCIKVSLHEQMCECVPVCVYLDIFMRMSVYLKIN